MDATTGLQSSHKKALKTLEGEKRAAIKKAKSTKGKKAKDAIAAVEEEFAERLSLLEKEFGAKLESLSARGNETNNVGCVEPIPNDRTDEEKHELSAKARKQLKARKRKERQKERESQLREELERENANAGPSLRQLELQQIKDVLTPLGLDVDEVEADGHCLYRSIAAQTAFDFQNIRSLCADALRENETEFSPFCELTDEVPSFDDYVNRVRNSAEWGGHLELRALSLALKRPIHVYSVQSGSKPLEIDPELYNDQPPIRLSYHLHYYSLGEHYNQVVAATT
eukprot:scaffold1888_cov120-Cylindrotheca_fusiformis.AAC.5